MMYRDARLACPRCGVALTHAGPGAACATCRGLWLDEGKLDEMVREMHDGLGALRFTERAHDRQLACPSCATPLANVVLVGVPVERCDAGHGVWFDTDELQAALRAAGEAAPVTTSAAGVPDVRVGFWGALLGGIGSLLGIAGYAVVGVAGVAAAATVGANVDAATVRDLRRELDDRKKR